MAILVTDEVQDTDVPTSPLLGPTWDHILATAYDRQIKLLLRTPRSLLDWTTAFAHTPPLTRRQKLRRAIRRRWADFRHDIARRIYRWPEYDEDYY